MANGEDDDDDAAMDNTNGVRRGSCQALIL